VCQWRRPDAVAVQEYLWHINLRMDELKSCTTFEDSNGVQEVVPMQMLKNNADFFTYLVKSNHE
jgi:hypothetical protein